jgi:hypothetical protein
MASHQFYQIVFNDGYYRINAKSRYLYGGVDGISQAHYRDMELMWGKIFHLIDLIYCFKNVNWLLGSIFELALGVLIAF